MGIHRTSQLLEQSFLDVISQPRQNKPLQFPPPQFNPSSNLHSVPSDQNLYMVNTSFGFISIIWPCHSISISLSTQHRQPQSNKWSNGNKSDQKWLKLPRNHTQVILYHPKVLNVLKAQNINFKAKLSLSATINRSTYHFIQELKLLLSSNSLKQGTFYIPSACTAIFEAVGAFVTSLPVLKMRCKQKLTSITTQQWDKHLQSLHV